MTDQQHPDDIAHKFPEHVNGIAAGYDVVSDFHGWEIVRFFMRLDHGGVRVTASATPPWEVGQDNPEDWSASLDFAEASGPRVTLRHCEDVETALRVQIAEWEIEEEGWKRKACGRVGCRENR